MTYVLASAVIYLLLLRLREGHAPPTALRILLDQPLAEFTNAAQGDEPTRGEVPNWARELEAIIPSVRDKKLREHLREVVAVHYPTDDLFMSNPKWKSDW